MRNKWQQMLQSIAPFFMLGLAIAAVLGLLIMFSWILLWGFVIGSVLWLVATIKRFIFPSQKNKTSHGRIIEYRDTK